MKRARFYWFFLLLLCDVACVLAEEPLASKQGPRIRSIQIKVNDVFEGQDLALFYRTANNIKPQTREHVIRRELLFKEGDVYDPFRIQESARFLRALPFLRQIFITPTFDGDQVDIIVSVQDTWTFVPFLSFSSGGGTKKESVGISESNLAGFGKRVEMLYANDEGRQKIEGVFEDRRLFGTYQNLTVGHFQRTDGDRTVVFYGRPFRSLVEPYSWSMEVESFDLVGRLFDKATESFIYRQRRDNVSGGFTFAEGTPTESVRRYTLGYEFSSDFFSTADASDYTDVNVDPNSVSHNPDLLAKNRRFSGPSVAFQRITPDFISLNYVDFFDRVEDFNLGSEFLARSTLALDAFGSFRNTLLLSANVSRGLRLGDSSFLRGRIGGSSRGDSHSFNNTIISSDVRYVNARGPKYIGDRYIGRFTDFASLEMDFGAGLDRDKQLFLGAFTGLRGYADRSFTGSQDITLTLEERVHLVDDLFRIVSLGSAVFVDTGGTSRHGFGDILDEQLRSDVGFGLRLGFPRSTGGGVIRIDVAFPTNDGVDGTQAWAPRLLITTGQGNTARLPNESTLNPGANVALKFLP